MSDQELQETMAQYERDARHGDIIIGIINGTILTFKILLIIAGLTLFVKFIWYL